MSELQNSVRAPLNVSGPLLIGHLLNWGLFGVISVQVYIYHLAFPNDHIRNKTLSYSVYVLEIIQTLMITQSAFRAFAEGFGNVDVLMDVGNMWFSVPILNGIIFFVTQMFYAYRVHHLSGSRILAALVVFFALVSFAGAIATGALLQHAATTLDGLVSQNTLITSGIWNGGNAVCDAIIAICMTVSLSRRSTGMLQSQALVSRVMRLTIETGSLTAAVAILNLILIFLPNHPGYFLSPIGVLGKLYSTSMMAVFNSRIVFSDGSARNLASASAVDLSPRNRSAEGSSANRPIEVAVKVTQEQLSSFSNEPTSFWEDKNPMRTS
ncbi:hypothetical protein CPB83DRAFT_498862 [Crepidotus variabilis]|uniref:DUF6534 domain-containing protein n=1 Tax=Crepidotus variabilis TaxID=179855 RepID=A0A9P6EBZ4_9AGAR|nr:hypothetical protein CPB83DRAFT_498862 [Crepidotus variabilis]